MATSVAVDSAAPNYLETIRANGHLIQCDEPQSAGGMDAGASPYELLLGALGACKAITVRMYAARKGWPLESVHVRLSHDRRHADDCLKCQDAAAQIDYIDVQVEIVGTALSASQRQTLLAVTEKCPLHRALAGGLQIRTRAAGPEPN